MNNIFLNQIDTWIQAIILALVGTSATFIFRYIFKNIGRIKIIINSVEIGYYKFAENKSKIKVNPGLSVGYDFFICKINFDLFNDSMQTKLIRNLKYEFHAWKEPYILYLKHETIYLKPKERYNFKIDINYQKDYHNFFIEKKHFISYLNSKDRRVRKNISNLTHFLKQDSDKFFTVDGND